MTLIKHILDLKQKCLSRENGFMDSSGLTSSEFNALLSFKNSDSLSCKAAASRIGLSESRTSRILNKLGEKSLVKFSYPDYDCRTVNVSLSQKGINLRKKIIQMLVDCDSEMRSMLSREEAENFINLVKKINSILEDKNHEGNSNGTSYYRFVQTESI